MATDTLSQPSEEMWMAMKSAARRLGMASVGEDSTVRELESVGAELLGHEAAYFLPTSTAAAAAALLAIDVRGTKVVMESFAHLWWMQHLHVSVLAGAVPVRLDGDLSGAMPLDALEHELTESAYGRRIGTSVVCIENTHNNRGGTTLSPAYTAALCETAHEVGEFVFLDGARIFNAATAQGVSPAALCRSVDLVVVSLNKAPAAPYGALLCGTSELIGKARLEASRLGANQVHGAGMLAAAALVGLEGMEKRILQEHAHARELAIRLNALPGVRVDLEHVQTNLVRADISGIPIHAERVCELLAIAGLRIRAYGPKALKFVIHPGIGRLELDTAVRIVDRVVSQLGVS